MKSYRLQVIGYRLWVTFLLVLCSFSSLYADNITTNLENNRLDLGRVAEGEVLRKSFFVANDSALPVKINVQALGCSCFEIISPKGKTELAAGAKQEVIFNFNTAGLDGKISKPLYTYTTDSLNPVIKIAVSADVAGGKEKFVSRFLSFSSLAVLGAGLVDGINPCAFTVMVFFISFLSFAGYGKKDMFIVGGLFILTLYITYLLIGAGLFRALRGLEIFSYFSRIFYRLISGFAFVIGLLNLYDFWVYQKTKNPDKIVLRLPALIKRRIQGAIRGEMTKKGSENRPLFALVAASITCGFLVSILELFCTGQLYLPTIAYILKVPDLKIKAVGYLLFYNLMFIIPLAVVFGLAFFGLTSSHFEKLARKHLSTVKLVTAVLFFGLGIALLVMKG